MASAPLTLSQQIRLIAKYNRREKHITDRPYAVPTDAAHLTHASSDRYENTPPKVAICGSYESETLTRSCDDLFLRWTELLRAKCFSYTQH